LNVYKTGSQELRRRCHPCQEKWLSCIRNWLDVTRQIWLGGHMGEDS